MWALRWGLPPPPERTAVQRAVWAAGAAAAERASAAATPRLLRTKRLRWPYADSTQTLHRFRMNYTLILQHIYFTYAGRPFHIKP